MSQHRIFLIGGGDDESGVLELVEGAGDCALAFTYRSRTIRTHAADYFEAFCAIRLELEKEGLIPFCYGASLNVHPSGMSRSMGSGLQAYRLTLGQKASRADLVDIFAAGPDVIPAFVSSQREHFRAWLAAFSTSSTS